MAYDKTKKTNLHTGGDLDADRENLDGRDKWPPNTTADVLADRATWVPAYGSQTPPPAPQWYMSKETVPKAIPGGEIGARALQIFWYSNVGAIAKGAFMPPYPATMTPPPPLNPAAARGSAGAKGVDGAGIAGHLLYVGEGAAPGADANFIIFGPRLNWRLLGYYAAAAPPPPGPQAAKKTASSAKLADAGTPLAALPPVGGGPWTPLKPDTTYQIKVAAFTADGTIGALSDILTVKTRLIDVTAIVNITDPDPPADLNIVGLMPDPASATAPIKISWKQGRDATAYEVYVNNSKATSVPMDPARPGLMIGDVLKGTVNAPANPNVYATYDIAGPHPYDTRYVIKVRSKRVGTQQDDQGGSVVVTEFSAFAPEIRTRTIPAPGQAPSLLVAP